MIIIWSIKIIKNNKIIRFKIHIVFLDYIDNINLVPLLELIDKIVIPKQPTDTVKKKSILNFKIE